MSYVTLSNLNNIVYSVDLKGKYLPGKVYKTKNMEFFTRLEKNKLIAIQMLLKEPLTFLKEIYRIAQATDTHRYVKPEKPHSYHKSSECPNIKSDFEGEKIPVSIVKKGDTEINNYRKWFREHKHLPKDIFSMHHMLAWHESPPTKIKIDNGGWTEKENFKIEDLENQIDNKIDEADKFINASESTKLIFKNFMSRIYLIKKHPISLGENKTGYSDEVVIGFLRDFNNNIKEPIQKLLIEYYRITLNPDLKLEGNLLDQLGLTPCAHCHTFM